MILRVLRGRVVEGDERNLAQYVRDEAIARALKVPGLLSFQPAVHATDTGIELVMVSTWTGFDDMVGAGVRLDQPLAWPEISPLLEDCRAEHYELVIGEARAMPLRQAKLRLTRILIKPNHEPAYYAAVRPWAERLLDESGMVSFTLGRRVVGRQDEIVAVQIFEDEAALRDVAGSDLERPMGRRELSQFWAAEPVIEHFDALTAIEPRPDAPAILVVDDSRRYVYATPAAAALSGRPLARLLTMRIEDLLPIAERAVVPQLFDRFIEAGSFSGQLAIERPDGTTVELRSTARANAPWPGSHAGLVVPAGAEDEDELDIDAALVEAGLVARYAPA